MTRPLAAHLRPAFARLLVATLSMVPVVWIQEPAAAHAAGNIQVDTSSDLPDADVHDGRCATSAGTCSLRAAITHALVTAGADTIDFDAPYLITVGSPLVIQDQELDIVGLGSGTGGTRIDGGGSQPVFVLLGPSSTSNVTILRLNNLRVQNGRRNLTAGADSVLQLQSCVVTGGSHIYDGGGLHAQDADVEIVGTEFSGNSAAGRGGGIFYTNSNQLADLAIRDLSRITGNSAGGDGGGISGQFLGTLTVRASEVSGNQSLTGNGGGIDSSMDLVVERSTVAGNSAAGDGGGIYKSEFDAIIVESTIANNQAAGNGGGLYLGHNQGDTPSHLTNSTISGNAADGSGGGLYLDTSVSNYQGLTLSNCTITDNIADEGGENNGNAGGLYRDGSYGSLEIANTILADNQDGSLGTFASIQPDCRGNLASLGYNIIGTVQAGCTVAGVSDGNLTGTLSSPVDPLLGALANNGLNTLTHMPESSSPAVDGGNPAGCADWDGSVLGWDQRLEPRPAGSGCDIGSVESPHVAPPLLTITIGGTADGTVTSSPAGISCPGDCSESYPTVQTVTLTAAPVDAVHDFFDGWTGDADCTDGQVTVDRNIACTAVFSSYPEHLFTLTLVGTGTGTVTVMPFNIPVTSAMGINLVEGTTLSMVAAADPDSTFITFGGDPDCHDGAVTMTSDIDCQARFELTSAIVFVDGFESGNTDSW